MTDGAGVVAPVTDTGPDADTRPIRLVISDVDGTLVRHDKSLSDANVAAFRRLRDAGVAATLISARPPTGMDWLVDALGLTGVMGAFNGGTLFTRYGIVGAPARLDADLAAAITAMGVAAGVEQWRFSEGLWYATNPDNPRVPHEKLSACLLPTIVGDMAAIDGPADKIAFISEDPDLLIRLEADARATFGARAAIARSQPYFLDFTAPLANKGDGVSALAVMVGVPLDQVAVIGDMPNDLPMFARAGTAIAMGQAPDTVKSAATFVTASNEDDGVAVAIDRFILPRAEKKP